MLFFFYTRLYQDEQKAQDCLQDLFMKVLDKLDTFDTKKRFSSWIYAIAANMCKNEYRNKARSWEEDENFDLSRLIDTTGSFALESETDKRYFANLLQQELAALSEENRMVFLLRHQDGLTIPEISEVLSCPEGTVKSKLFYTVKKLNEKLHVFKD